jgi:hypothetical protein
LKESNQEFKTFAFSASNNFVIFSGILIDVVRVDDVGYKA